MEMGTTLMISLFFSSIGAGYFIYGKKQQLLLMMLSGIALCIFPYFTSNGYVMALIGVVLTALPWVVPI